jgi:uncharacterized membrane protein HdeD (DUF308 family)
MVTAMAQASGIDQITNIFRKTRLIWAMRAIAALVIGVLVLVWPESTITIIAVLLGIYFAVLGVIRIVEGFTDKELNGGGRAANFIIGALILAAGIIVIRNPFETAVFVVLLVGISWIFEGVAVLVDTARGNGSAVSAIIGVAIAILGILVILFADGVTIAYAVFFGIVLLIVGVLDLVLLLTVGRAIAKAKG